jgi:orotate phosphoribosyltransferase
MTDSERARRVAEHLIRIRAVHCNLETPFVFTSGTLSPVYVDIRRLISFPAERRETMDLAARMVETEIGADNFDVVAGGETAGIPYAAWLAERFDAPMIYVRKQAKAFGRMSQIEGRLEEGQRVLLVEDLITDGGSKFNFLRGVRQAGARVEHLVVVFEYGTIPETRPALAAEGVALHSLTTWAALLEVAESKRYFTTQEIAETRRFLTDPKGWGATRQGARA